VSEVANDRILTRHPSAEAEDVLLRHQQRRGAHKGPAREIDAEDLEWAGGEGERPGHEARPVLVYPRKEGVVADAARLGLSAGDLSTWSSLLYGDEVLWRHDRCTLQFSV